jgi:hypothetical protein
MRLGGQLRLPPSTTALAQPALFLDPAGGIRFLAAAGANVAKLGLRQVHLLA